MPVSITASITENSISVDNNSSSVTVKVKASWTSGSYDHNPPKLTVTIDGVKYTKSVSLNPNNTTSGSSTIYSKTLNITHKEDGSKTLTVSASYATSTSSGTVKDSVSKTLTTIARKSAPTCPSSATLGDTITIATNQKSSSFTHTLTASWNGQTTTIATKTTQSSVTWTIPFSWCTAGSSGTCTITCTTYDGSTSLGSNICSFTLQRPGTSVLYQPVSSCLVDGSSSVEINTQGNAIGYTHLLSYTVNDVTWTDGIADPTIVGTTTFTPPVALLDHITEAESASCTIRLDTYFDGTVLASDYAVLTLIVPASILPKAEITEVSDTVTFSEGSTKTLLDHYGAFISGKSIPKMTVTGTESYSSQVMTYMGIFTSGSSVSSSDSVITSDQVIKESDTTFTATVTDARGRTSETAERSVTVLSYTEPKINAFRATRMSLQSDGTLAADDAGTILRVTYDISVSALNDKNAKTAVLTWTNLTDSSSGTINLTLTSYHASGTLDIKGSSGYEVFSSTSRYKLTLSVTDDFTTAESTVVVQTAEVILDFHAGGKGMAIGKISEGDGFECQYDAKFNGKLTYKGKELLDLIYPVGAIYLSVNAASPSDLFGGTWEQISGKFLLASGNGYTIGDNGGEEAHTLTSDEMPVHHHSGITDSDGSHSHSYGSGKYVHLTTDGDTGADTYSGNVSGSGYKLPRSKDSDSYSHGSNTASSGSHTHSFTTGSSGGGAAHNNMPPYLVVNVWKRTA
jgi:microcystin-dependent protein|nr:MAG TPA_asm: baseplate protein [Caudoviricetes sp.]